MRGRSIIVRGVVLLSVLGGLEASGCGGAPDAVRDIAARKLRCGHDEIEVALNRETRTVREYAAGCNFMYTRVHCTDQGCKVAEAEPPCLGNLPCFEEDPETLTWRVADSDEKPRHTGAPSTRERAVH
jgi:hypothetical protein